MLSELLSHFAGEKTYKLGKDGFYLLEAGPGQQDPVSDSSLCQLGLLSSVHPVILSRLSILSGHFHGLSVFSNRM